MKWLAMLLAWAAVAALLALASPARAGWTCDHAQAYRTEILNLTAEQRREWIRILRLTRKQVRQAKACLRGARQ